MLTDSEVDEFGSVMRLSGLSPGLWAGVIIQRLIQKLSVDNATDIGIPIEAFTIEGFLPRF